MFVARLSTALILALFCVCPQVQEQVQKITVTGKLNRTMTIGGESKGWTIYLDPETTIEGKQASSIEVDYPKTEKLEKLNSKRVTATGFKS
jgi:hypothetical protein